MGLQQENKVKSLSPAISAFQFQHNKISSSSLHSPLEIKTTEEGDYFTTNSYQSSPNCTPDVSKAEEAEEETSNGVYAYNGKLYMLNEEIKKKLLAMGQLPLDGEWVFWYDKFVPNLPASDYESNLQIVSAINTVQKFWSVYNNIDSADKLGFRSNYHFMKKGIKPIWEDPKNKYGGSYNFKIQKHQTRIAWRDILLLLIGEKVEGWIKNTVFGVSVSSRQHVDNYQIWTAHHNMNIQDNVVRSKLKELLYPADIQSFYFKMHKTHADFQKPCSTPTTPTHRQSEMELMLASRPTEMRRKITEENIEKVVQDIEKLKLRERKLSGHQATF